MCGFSQVNRLTGKQGYQSVFASSKKVSHRFLLALYKANQRVDTRLGIVITKRRLRSAVQRNRLRRLIRESFRHHKEALQGLDIIVLLRSECNTLNKLSLRDDIDRLWSKLIHC